MILLIYNYQEVDPTLKTLYDMFDPEANGISGERFKSVVAYAEF